MDDREILSLFLERSEQAITALSQQYDRICRHFARNLLDSDSDAEECVNDAYLAVWDTIPPEQPDSILGYLLGLLRNICFDRVKYQTATKRNVRLETCLDELLPCISDHRGDSVVDSLVLRDALNKFIGSLSKTDRYIFLRRYYHMDSNREIARGISMGEKALSARLVRLRQRLKEHLEKEDIFV